MPRPAPPTDTIRVALTGSIFTHPWTNVFWCKVTTDGTKTINDLADLLDLIIAEYASGFWDDIGSDAAGLTADGVWQTGASTILSDTRNFAHTGQGNPSVDDAGACAVVNWKITARYRGGKPRTYLAGPPKDMIDNGSTLDGTFRSNLAAGAVSFMAAVNGFTGTHIATCALGTVSFFTAGGSETQPPTYRTPPVFEPYVGSGVKARLGSQRRRIAN